MIVELLVIFRIFCIFQQFFHISKFFLSHRKGTKWRAKCLKGDLWGKGDHLEACTKKPEKHITYKEIIQSGNVKLDLIPIKFFNHH